MGTIPLRRRGSGPAFPLPKKPAAAPGAHLARLTLLRDRPPLLPDQWNEADVRDILAPRSSAFIHTGLTRARGSMFTHFTPADLVAILNIPRLQTLP